MAFGHPGLESLKGIRRNSRPSICQTVGEERLLSLLQSAMTPASQCLSERFRGMTSLWHLWRASVLEDMGEVPIGLEEAVESTLKECLQDARERLQVALQSCDASLTSLSVKHS